MPTIRPVILAFDTSSAACTAALFDGGECVARRDELIGRGHAERLVPMIAEMLDGRRPASIIVGVGPGSFTGIRVAIAAAHGLAIGWDAELRGMSSLALLAAGAAMDGEVAAAVTGGHGELFVQQFDAATLEPSVGAAQSASGRSRPVRRCDARRRIRRRSARRGARLGRGARCLALGVEGPAVAGASANATRQARLRPRSRREGPGGGVVATPALDHDVQIAPGSADQIDAVMRVMDSAFGDRFGEAWTRSQLSGILPMAGVR